jgi:hypothetical protein
MSQELPTATPKAAPVSPERLVAARRSRATFAAIACVLVAAILVVGTGAARAGWEQISHFLSLRGMPVVASANVLSEPEIEALDSMSPQNQAELLLERSIA